MATSMQQAISALKTMFEEKGWKYQNNEDDSLFSVNFGTSNSAISSVRIMIRAYHSPKDEDLCSRIISYGFVNIRANENCMSQVCEYLTRANYGLSYGNFELDFQDGEIRYKMGYNVLDALPGTDAMEDLVGVPVTMFSRYGNGLLAVITGMLTPEAAIEQIGC